MKDYRPFVSTWVIQYPKPIKGFEEMCSFFIPFVSLIIMQSQVWFGVLHTVTSGHSISNKTFIFAVQSWAQAMHAVWINLWWPSSSLHCAKLPGRPVSIKESPGYKCCTPAGSSGTCALCIGLWMALYVPEVGNWTHKTVLSYTSSKY